MSDPITIEDRLAAAITYAVDRIAAGRDRVPFDQDRLPREGAAEYIGLKVATLEADSDGKHLGIPFYKVGRRIFYRQSDLDLWLEKQKVGGDAEAAA